MIFALATALFALGRWNFLLFHSLVEVFVSIIIFSTFLFAWNSRLDESGFLQLVGYSLSSVGTLEILHLLAYKGISVFPGYDENLPIQLWIASRYLLALILFTGPFLNKKRFSKTALLLPSAALTAVLVVAIFSGIFPSCFVEGIGPTRFKIISEYIFSLLMIGSLVGLWNRRRAFDAQIWKLLATFVVLTIVAELTFTSYLGVYGVNNTVGHLLMMLAFYFLYKALVETGIRRPVRLMFRDLAAAERRWRSVFNNVYDAIFIHDVDGEILDVNDRMLALYEVTREQALELTIREYSGRESPIQDLPEIWKKVLRGESQHFEWRAKKPATGEEFDVEVFLRRFQLDERPVIIANVRDITDRKRAQESLRVSEQHFRELAESVPELVWTYEPDGSLDYFNRRCSTYTGLNFSGREVPWHLLIAPEDYSKARELWNQSLAKGKDFEFEHRLRRADGVYRWHIGRATPIRDSKGMITKWVRTCSDIHDRRSWAEELRESQERLETALEAGQMATWENDFADPEIKVSSNHGRLYGRYSNFPRWDFKTFLENTHPEDRARVEAEITTAIASGKSGYSLDFRVLWPNGSARWLNTRARFIRDLSGRVTRIHGAVLDISKIKEAEHLLKQAVEMRDEFLSIASHELKTPLTSLQLQIEILRRSTNVEAGVIPSPERLARALELSTKQLKRFGTLIEDLLDVSRARAGKLELHRENIDLSSLVKEVTERFSEELKSTKSNLELEIKPDVTGYWDHTRLEQVVANLLSNAIKYAPGKPVRVVLEQSDSKAFLTVADSGAGIDPEKHGKIFQKFERATSSRNISGLGLGLYIVNEIVSGHGGVIRVESGAGKGATFIIELPGAIGAH